MLTLRGFLPAVDKVQQVEFHPVLPWLACATKSDQVLVWDWRTKQVIWEAQLNGPDEDLCADAELARLHLRDPAFNPNPSLLHPIPSGPKREPSGRIRDVHFLDCDVAQLQLTWQHTLAAGCGSPPPRAEELRTLRGQRLLVIACDCKVLVVDLVSRRVLELGRGVFEGRSPSALAFMFRAGLEGGRGWAGGAGAMRGGSGGGAGRVLMESPVLAVGCNDGVVRCVQLFPIKPIAKLVSAHKTPVASIAVVAMRGQRIDTLAVGHQGGRVVLYEPLGRNPLYLLDGVPPRAEYRAHERELLPGSLVAGAVEEDPEGGRAMLFSAGSDHRVCGVDLSSLKTTTPVMSKLKVDGHVALTCMTCWPRGWTSSGVHTLLLGSEGGHLLLGHPGSGSVRQAAALEGMVPAGHKRVPKVYSLSVHPTMPFLVAAATNTGVAILGLAAQQQPLPLAPLPLTSPTQAHARDSGDPLTLGGELLGVSGGGGGVTYVAAMGKHVLCVTAAVTSSQDVLDFLPNQVMGKLQVATDSPGSRALVTISHDGSFVAVAWPGPRQYAVYRQGASAWQQVAKGNGTSVAWHPSRPLYAALEEEVPASLASTSIVAGKLSKDPKKAEKQVEAARAALDEAAKAATANASIRLRLLSYDDGGRPPPPVALDLRGDVPSYVQGGPLLAVTVRRTVQAEVPDLVPAGGSAPALLLFDWESGRRVGPELPDPLLLSWDPSRTLMALAYTSQLLIVRARPSFQVVASLPVCEAQSLEWATRQLYIATPTHILLALLSPSPHLPAAPPSPGGPTPLPTTATTATPARLITLAAPGVSASSSGAAGSYESGYDSLLPPPERRPPGPIALLGPRDGCLWMVGVAGQPMALGLTHCGLQCCCLAASGDLQGAVSLGSRALAPQLHDQLAALLTELNGLRGAAAAVTLPGITLTTEITLRRALRQWQPAVEAAEAALVGYVVRPPAGSFRSTAAAAAFGGGVGLGGGSSRRGTQLGEEFVDLSQAAGGVPATAPAHPEDLDWTQPLRAAGSSAKAAATAVVAARRGGAQGGGGAHTGGSLVPSATTLQLVLGLMEDLARAGMYDVVRYLVKPVLVHGVHLGGEQLRSLAAIMAQAGMKTDLPSLAHSVAAGADSADREGAGLLAALLSGHTALVQDSLREGGAGALAALQARVYGLSGAGDSMAGWRRQLAAGVPTGAAAALGRLDVTVPA